MKAKFLMMAAFGAMAVTLTGCTDDPKNDFPEDVFEIRQLRLEATNTANGTKAISSESPVNGSTKITYVTVNAEGVPFTTKVDQTQGENAEEPKLIGTSVTLTKPTDAIIGAAGQTVDFIFKAGQMVKTATLTFPQGVEPAAEQSTTLEEGSTLTATLGDFAEGALISGLHQINQDGSLYNYTGAIYLWHYHPINLRVVNKSTQAVANTPIFNKELNAIVRTAVMENGQIKYDEDGAPIFVDESVLTVAEGQTLTLEYTPAYPGDQIVVAMPDGSNIVFNEQNKSVDWTVTAFQGDATISATLQLQQENLVHVVVTGAITLTTAN